MKYNKVNTLNFIIFLLFISCWTRVFSAGALVPFCPALTPTPTPSCPCPPTPITAPTILTVPGFYCLANDINSTLTIAGPNIKVDLNHHNISAPGATGIFIDGAVNTVIMNGTIFDVSNGLELNNTSSSVFRDLALVNCSVAGIQLDTVQSCILFQDIVIDTVADFGIGASNFVGDLVASALLNITIRNCSGAAISLPVSVACIFNNCQIVDCSATGNRAFAVGSQSILTNCLITHSLFGGGGFFANGIDTIMANCSVVDLTCPNGGTAFSTNMNTILENCSVISLIVPPTGGSAIAFALFTNNEVRDCSAINIEGGTGVGFGATGFSANGSDLILENCIVQGCASGTPVSTSGFLIDADQCVLIGCKADLSTGNGFNIVNNNGGAILQYCVATSNGINGFFCQDITPSLGYCSAFNNSTSGFNIAAVGITMYGCFASHNPSNYINGTNVAAATVAGAFENSFI